MKRIIFHISLIFALFMIISCGRSDKSSSPSEGINGVADNLISVSIAQFDNNNMQLGQPVEQSFKNKVQVNGLIDVPPQNKVVISVPLGGYITRTTLLVGDKVKRGQVLATLENPEFISLQQKYLEVKEELPYLKAEYERHQTLFEENITSQKNYLKSQSEYKKAQATFSGLREQLNLLHIPIERVEAGNLSASTSIYAPIEGSISKMNITKGAYISPATEVMEIINTDHIHLELAVFEKDIIQIKEGQDIVFRIPEASATTYEGAVYRVGKSIDENRRILVHGHIDNSEEFNFIKGMFVDATIITDSISRMSFPESAVVESGGKYFVLKLAEKTDDQYLFTPVEIEVYARENDRIAVGPEELINPNDQYLTSEAFSLLGSY